MLLDLISELKILFRDFPSLKDKIDKNLLLNSLGDLEKLAELDDVKETVCLQIKAIIFRLIQNQKIEDSLHHILYGPPGVGKSTVAKVIASIFKSLGVIQAKKTSIRKSLSDFKYIFSEVYLHHNNDKYIPDNLLKQYWKTLKILFDNENYEDDSESDIVVCGRQDLIAGFAGQSSLKTFEFLLKNRGKCVIIEEAYLLWTGENDGYGMEALTVLNRFMEEFEDEIIIIMTGYKDLIMNTIFKAQPGLKRRINCIYELSGYSPESLSQVFCKQIFDGNWLLSPEIDTVSFFRENYSSFPSFGGDTKRFAWVCKMIHSSKELMNYINEPNKIPMISLENFELAFEKYCKNCVK